MRLIILGAGAVGGVVGGLLTRAKRDVVLLARGAQLEAIRAGGLTVESPTERFTVTPAIADAAAPFAFHADDVLLVALKTQDVAAALRDVAPPAHVPIVCLTNGIEAERLALRHSDHVYGACLRLPATYLTPGLVQVWATPIPGVIDLGRYPDGPGDHADELAGELMAAGFDSRVYPTIMKWKRAKLLSNLANAIDALCAGDTDDLEAAAVAEGRRVFATAGLSCASHAEHLARGVEQTSQPIAGATRGGGSTWQSLTRGARTLETDYLNGEIALLGRVHGVPTPINTALQSLAAAHARAGLPAHSLSADELRARLGEAASGQHAGGS
jgi:2-dehydropantoate 2-reductase